MKSLLLLLTIFTLSLYCISCKKNDDKSCEECGPLTKFAYVIDGGVPAADGVGYYIKLDDSTGVHPSNLPDEYKQPNIHQKVKINFTYTGEYYQSGMMVGPGMKVIVLTSIEKQ